MNWLVVVSACVVVGLVGWGVASLVEGDEGFDCDGGFIKADWQSHKTTTGRAVAECDWFDGETVTSMRRALGKPDHPPHRGWYTWEIGDSRAGIGPASWFLLLRVPQRHRH